MHALHHHQPHQPKRAVGLACRCRGEHDTPGLHTAIPLIAVRATATVTDVVCEVNLTQRYRNDEEHPIEAVYTFPLDARAAVCRFEAEVDGHRWVGRVMPDDEARDTYDDAIASGGGAYLLEQKKDEIFHVSVGNLPPGKECTIHITYVAELSLEGDKIRFALPTTIAPRYHGPGTTAEETKALEDVCYLPDSSRAAGSVYGLELDVAIELPSPIVSVESPSHPIRFQMDAESANRGKVTLATQEAALDRDFVLLIVQRDAHRPGLWLDKDRQAVMLSVLPQFRALEHNCEFIFLVDRSGSMTGDRIVNAKKALQLFLHSLPAGCRFNRFGNRHEQLFNASQPYDEHTLEKAIRHVDRMGANLGGTDILTPLSKILGGVCDPNYSRQIFILTDGQVSNTGAVIQAIANKMESKMKSSIKDALDSRICTYERREYLEQYWFRCRTCFSKDPLSGCCLVCKEVCHKGHDLEPRYGDFFCDCGDSGCAARNPDETRKPVVLPPPVSLRVFTLGIGFSVSRELVLGMARAGQGTAEFVMPGERMESKVMRQLRLAMQPSVKDMSCSWGAEWGPVLEQIPKALPPVFDGVRLCIFGLLKAGATLPLDATDPITITYTLPVDPTTADSGEQKHEFSPSAAVIASTSAVRTLAARSLIKELDEECRRESETDKKARIVSLGVRYQLATAYTSFVAVEERDTATGGTMQRRVVRSHLPINHTVPRQAYRALSLHFHGRGAGRSRGRGLGYAGGGFDFAKAESRDRKRKRSRSPSPNRERKRECERYSLDDENEIALSYVKESDHDILSDLVILQRANGSFTLSEELARLLRKSLDDLRTTFATIARPDITEEMWATALALAFLEMKLHAIANDWAMLADKSRRWLRGKSTTQDSIDALLDHAKKALPT